MGTKEVPLCICYSANGRYSPAAAGWFRSPCSHSCKTRRGGSQLPAAAWVGRPGPKPLVPATLLCQRIWNNSVEPDKRKDSVSYDKGLLLPILLLPLSYLNLSSAQFFLGNLFDSSVKKLLQAVCTPLEAFPHISVFHKNS